MAIDYQLLGKRVLQLRKEKGWSQERLAEKSGISNNYVSNIENCYSIPSLETLMKLCDAFQITPNDLLLGVSQENKSYLNRDIAELLEQCSAQEKKYIYKIIKVFLSEHPEV
ncbi:helix-turn-helix domain-containing protein [Negativibacillus massiliensis]|uniref:helix-turn-helix domain-containing protein n=1 Tax=Negativibacillus massiliensis TaxID=1871035 RepID=UPI000334A75F|nr:helix-turn-helix transcriptional regulator [Negativibacillus massiliensis]CDA77990.1 helix-turn-helix family protein [Clostridium sp. CAG:242]